MADDKVTRVVQDVSNRRIAYEGAKSAGSFFTSTAGIVLVLFLLFGGGGLSLLQEIIKEVPVVVILGVVAIIFIFRS